MGKTARVLKGCLFAAGFFVLSSALLLGLYIAWGLHANHRAEAAAKALCAGTRPGDRIESVLAKAQASDPKPRVGSAGGEYRFTFPGMIFAARECQVSTAQGRVTATHIQSYDD